MRETSIDNYLFHSSSIFYVCVRACVHGAILKKTVLIIVSLKRVPWKNIFCGRPSPSSGKLVMLTPYTINLIFATFVVIFLVLNQF